MEFSIVVVIVFLLGIVVPSLTKIKEEGQGGLEGILLLFVIAVAIIIVMITWGESAENNMSKVISSMEGL